MRAMILAAGRGERMRELTLNTPKPLLKVQGRYLIEYAILRLASAGVSDIVINISYRGLQIKAALGDGSRYGVSLHYSEEQERLETGGGIFQALPLLGKEPFIVLSGDVLTDFPLENLPKQLQGLAHLVMVDNPVYHPNGDFGMQGGKISLTAKPALTFGNISLLHPDLFKGCEPGIFRLSSLLLPAIEKGQVTGEYYQGKWHNIGTPEDLNDVNAGNMPCE
ncbi:MAG: nucleotidyltransferase family protein [Gammaproteobacteria bacterium]